MSVAIFIFLVLLGGGAAAEPNATNASLADGPHLTTDDGGFLTVIQGFATQLQCVLNTCSSDVNWYKDGEQISKGINFLNATHEKAYKMQHSIEVDYEKGCSGECDDSKPCAAGFSCVDNQCCSCRREEFTLVLRNLTFDESGRYKCQLGEMSELLEFQVEVLESGLKGGFHQNISYDHSECCQKKGISPLCRGMCKPSEMDQYHFDPTSCKTDDYKHFLSCATDEGTRSHVHCCKTQLVPSFCYDFCSGDFKMLRRSHRLCLYYLPEIFSCLDRAYLPFPDPPQEIEVNALEHDQLSVCWEAPTQHESNRMFPVLDYTVYYKEIPNFPLLGGDMGIPLLTGDYSDISDIQEDDYHTDDEDAGEEVVRDSEAPKFKRSVEIDAADNATISVSRSKRSTMVIVTRDDATNSTTVREFTFKNVTTSETCASLSDLRSATRYIVYVTARNEYGTSVPSVRNIASTNVHTVSDDKVLPDAGKCCSNANVSSACAEKMCNVSKDPTTLSTITIATTCRSEWPKVSPCIADGRNHTDCCLRKGVQHDCLEICAGSTKELGVHSVLCLNLDLQAIYQCIRQGYETHPSAPVNVTLSGVTAHSVTVKWDAPQANSHLVENYTMFIRLNEHGQPVKTVHNVKSPHTENGLDPDSDYVLTIQSHSANGTSLPSTAKLFSTLATTRRVAQQCPAGGEPIYQNDGRVVTCNHQDQPCPVGFYCTDEDDSDDLPHCCPHIAHSADYQTCCQEQNMPKDCLSYCNQNVTRLPAECHSNLNIWLSCGSAGHDHTRCCLQENIPKLCLSGCKYPHKVGDDVKTCEPYSPLFQRCFQQARLRPAVVRNFEITSTTKDSATVSWDDVEDGILMYRIQLFDVKTKKLAKSVNTTADIYRFSELESDHEYSAQIVAVNRNGEGTPSWNVTFTTLSAKPLDGERPEAPVKLQVAWNSGPRVNITWKPVTAYLDGSAVRDPIEYTVYYLDTEANGSWTTIKTNNTWIVLRDLRQDSLYHVYLTAKCKEKLSRSSSIITILAQQDSLGLPEPFINIEPDNTSGVYKIGQKINIKCQIYTDLKTPLNIDLTVGHHVVQNDHGGMVVYLETEADESMDTATCSVSDTDGRQHVAMQHLTLQKTPTVSMKNDKVFIYNDQPVEIECQIQGGGPRPNVGFEKNGTPPTRGFMKFKKTENGYFARWVISAVKAQDAGDYVCVLTTEDGQRIEAKAEVVFGAPVDPKQVLQCCKDEGISGDCLEACSTQKSVVQPSANCSRFSKSYFKCATGHGDHTDCCILARVPQRCLSLCNGAENIADPTCSVYAINLMSCYLDHTTPTSVTNVRIGQIDNDGKVHVEWDFPPTENYKYFTVFYRKKSDYKNALFWTMSTIEQSIDLDINTPTDFEIGISASNEIGSGPIVYSKYVQSSEGSGDRKGSSGAFWIFVILVTCAFLLAVLTIVSKRRELPYPFGKIMRRRNDLNQPTVAFENPAYDSFPGNEVEIRGLGNSANSTTQNSGSEWQSPSLEASNENSHEYRNGMRYAKLET